MIASEFALPADNILFSSYMGNHAKRTYTVKSIAGIAKKSDVNKEEQFLVRNTYNNKMYLQVAIFHLIKKIRVVLLIQTPLKTKTIFQHYQ